MAIKFINKKEDKMETSKKQIAFFGSICLLLVMTALPFMATHAEAQVKLKYGSYAPQGAIDDPMLWYIDEVSKRSGVNIKVETYFGGTLAKPPDCLDALGKGVYDIGWISSVFTPAKTPLAVIPNGTPLVAPTLYSASGAADKLVRTFPAAAAEFEKANVKYLFSSGVWHYTLISKKPVKSLEDIKGLRVRTFGYLARAWAELGGVPVSIPIPEIYDALQKGTLDAVLTQPISMYKSLRLCEVAKHFTRIELGCLPVPVLMNMGTWSKLPEKVRKEMVNLGSDMPKMVDQIISGQELKTIEEMEKEGISIYNLPAADKARIREVAKVIAKIVVDDLAAKGVTNAKEAMDIYLSAIEKYSK
jgi:TRAP-type C4-dicarboxylate transport system substrate-binding protein